MSIFDRFVWKNMGADSQKRRIRLATELTERLAANAAEDQDRWSEDQGEIAAFLPALDRAIKGHIDSQAEPTAENPVRPAVDASVQFCLSQDHMKAYACILPPLDGGRDMELSTFLDDLRYEGVSYGVLEEQAAEMLKKYLHVFPVAAGTQAEDGVDGTIIDLFERRAAIQLECSEESAVDFSQENPVQAVRKGEIICRVTPPVAGKPGRDVTGHPISCRDGVAVTLPAGENTTATKDGLLLAAIDGVVSMEEEKFCVKQQKIILGDVDGSSGAIRCLGDLYIGGDVYGGATVEATGNVIISGNVRDAHICSSEQNVRVQKGVQGGGRATLKAARQLQAPIIEGATVQTGGDVFAEVIAASDVTSGSGVYVLGGRGLILGGQVKAKGSVAAKKIGNLSDQRNVVIVGYSPKLAEEIKQADTKLAETVATLEKLRKNISNLRAAGDLLSLEKRAVLSQLTEQRSLYEDQETKLNLQMKKLKQALHAATSGKIVCQELYPVTRVQIGDREAEFSTAETNCNIHLYAGRIVVK